MASPTGGDFRNTYFGPMLSRAEANLVLLLAAVESHESSYTPTHYSDLTSALAGALSSLGDAEYANAHDNT